MRKMLFLLLSGAIFGACSSDKDRVLVFVKNVVMPPDSWVFAPGDGVTVSAEGFASPPSPATMLQSKKPDV